MRNTDCNTFFELVVLHNLYLKLDVKWWLHTVSKWFIRESLKEFGSYRVHLGKAHLFLITRDPSLLIRPVSEALVEVLDPNLVGSRVSGFRIQVDPWRPLVWGQIKQFCAVLFGSQWSILRCVCVHVEVSVHYEVICLSDSTTITQQLEQKKTPHRILNRPHTLTARITISSECHVNFFLFCINDQKLTHQLLTSWETTPDRYLVSKPWVFFFPYLFCDGFKCISGRVSSLLFAQVEVCLPPCFQLY